MASTKLYPLDPRHAIGCIDAGLRVALVYQLDDVVAEYHFVKYPLKDNCSNYNITCSYYTSQSTDPLKISGAVTTLVDFDSILIQRDYYYVGRKRFTRVGLYALPYDWYNCFETDPQTRLQSIKQLVDIGKKRGEDLEEARKKERAAYW